METSPSSGCSSPTIIRNSVVLPAPFGPTRPTFSPGLSWNEVSTKRIWRPYCLLTWEREITNPEYQIGDSHSQERQQEGQGESARSLLTGGLRPTTTRRRDENRGEIPTASGWRRQP